MKRVLTILLVVVLALSLSTVFAPAQKAMAADGIYNVPSPSYPTIQAAINAAYAAGGGTVNVAPGVYLEFITLKSGVKVLGAGQYVTVLDGGGTHLLVSATHVDSTAVLSGFTITNGKHNYGAICVIASSLVITDCFIIGNEGYFGGGMYIGEGSPMVTNCNFSANKASDDGGGIWGKGTVTNCTFSTNKASDEGGGMWIGGTATVTNCILWDDSAATGAEIYQASGASAVVTYCDVQGGYDGAGNKDADPMFAEPGNIDFHLLPDSPCIDVGNDDAVPEWLTTDFEGDDRIIGARVDMGVDEFVPTVANQPPVAVDDSATTDEDTAVTISVLDNDSDPDQDTLTVDSVTQGVDGSVAINEDDTVTYTPNPGFYGEDSFTYTASDGKGGTDTATVTVTVNPLVTQVTIDIKPGSDPNGINLGSKGVVPVAVLTTDDFDASLVDPTTVEFAGAAPERWTSEDVNEDGDLDMLFHFRTQELELTEDSEDATLTGQTTDGHEITGTDSVMIILPKGKK